MVVFKDNNLMPFLLRLLKRHSGGKRPRLATSQAPSGVEFKGQSHNFQTKIDLLNLNLEFEGGKKCVSAQPTGSEKLMRCGFLSLCCQTSHST